MLFPADFIKSVKIVKLIPTHAAFLYIVLLKTIVFEPFVLQRKYYNSFITTYIEVFVKLSSMTLSVCSDPSFMKVRRLPLPDWQF